MANLRVVSNCSWIFPFVNLYLNKGVKVQATPDQNNRLYPIVLLNVLIPIHPRINASADKHVYWLASRHVLINNFKDGAGQEGQPVEVATPEIVLNVCSIFHDKNVDVSSDDYAQL